MFPGLFGRLAAGALVGPIVLATLGASGCGTASSQQGTFEAKGEPEYRYEGTGRAKTKTLVRPRDKRREWLQQEAKKQG